jgi:hypothetical protein
MGEKRMNRSNRTQRDREEETRNDTGTESARGERAGACSDHGRLPGEMESAMASGSGDEGDLSVPDPVPTDLTPEEARQVLTAPVPDEMEAEDADEPAARPPAGRH